MRAKLLCLFLTVAGPGVAQAQLTPWAHTMQNADFGTAHAIVLDASGNTYVGGSFKESTRVGGSQLRAFSPYLYGAYVAKYSLQGVLLWVRQPMADGVGHGVGVQSLAVDADGNLLLGGEFEGGALTLGTHRLPAHADPRLAQGYVARIDPQGTVQWVRATTNDRQRATVSALATDASGAVYAAGTLDGRIPFICRFSAAGQPELLATTPGGPGDVLVTGLALSADGRQLALSGRLRAGVLTLRAATAGRPALEVSSPTAQGTLGFVAGFAATGSAAGEAQWAQVLACGIHYGQISQVAAAGSGFVVAGDYTGETTLGTAPKYSLSGSSQTSSGLVAWLNSHGEMQWAREITGNNYIETEAVAVDTSGVLTVAGSFAGQLDASGDSLTSAGGFDGFLLTYSPQGVLQAARREGGAAEDFVLGIALGADAQPRVVGCYGCGGSLIAGTNLPAPNYFDGFVACLSAAGTAYTPADGPAATFTVGPNPARAGEPWQLLLGSELTAGPATVQVFNMMGQEKVMQQLLPYTPTVTVPTTDLPAGCYVLRVRGAGGVSVRRVVVE